MSALLRGDLELVKPPGDTQEFYFEELFLSSDGLKAFHSTNNSGHLSDSDSSDDEVEVEPKQQQQQQQVLPLKEEETPVPTVNQADQKQEVANLVPEGGKDSRTTPVNLRSSKQVKLNKVGLEDFVVLKKVGEGGYGKVYQVQKKSNLDAIYAMKVLRKDYIIEQDVIENTKTERDVLKKVRHPFVVGLRYAFQTAGRLYLIMDFVNGGQLFFHLRAEAMFSERMVQFYAGELILALEHLHSLGIIHRDLKPENILLDSTGNIVLTDFGFAKENITDQNRATSFCGTMEYMSPEMLKSQPYGKETDWWSLGILIYDMLIGKPPFRAKNPKTFLKQMSKPLKFPSYLTPSAIHLIRGLVQKDVSKRITLKELKSHRFFQGLEWNKLLKKEVTPPFIPKVANKLDVSNFDVADPTTTFSPDPKLSKSQEGYFVGFTYVRSYSPKPIQPLSSNVGC